MRRQLGRLTLFGAIALLPALSGAASAAPARVVVLPVAVGGAPDPQPQLMTALAEGLRQNAQWTIHAGPALKELGNRAPMKDEDLTRIEAKANEAADQIKNGAAAEAVAALEPLRNELAEAHKKAPRGEKGDSLAYRVAGLLVAALQAGNQAEQAKALAEQTAASFPGRKPAPADGIPADAAALLGGSQAPAAAAKVTIKTRPEGCEILVGGVPAGRSPATVTATVGGVYWAQGRCPTSPGMPARTSAPKRIVVSADDATRQEVIDLEFESAFEAEDQSRVRFANASERRQLEDSYARRLAERYDADVVVLASVGELSGADWLNGRLYLRSGYLNRQGLVRLEVQRANALGRFLATGKDVPGVLKPEEAGAMVAASQTAATPDAAPPRSPWYTDIAGWALTGVGAGGLAFGLWRSGVADDQMNEADAIRDENQFDRRTSLYNRSTRNKFWGSVGTIGGGIMLLTGVVLLAIPEYSTSQGELFVLSPSVMNSGAGMVAAGRF